MDFEYDRHYDLSALLKFDDLDVRQTVKDDPYLLVGSYFDLLSRFLNQAPHALSILFKIASFKGNKVDFNSLAELGYLLYSLNCKRYLPGIEDIVSSGKRGHKEFAASCAKELSPAIKNLYLRVMNTEKTQEMKNLKLHAEDKEESDLKFEDLPLKNALEILAQKEATRKVKILAIDDSPVILKNIASILGPEYIVYGMVNPAMLEKFLMQITPELFLLDYRMPEISGFDPVPIIRSFKEHKETSIIFMTSDRYADHLSASMMFGTRDYIIKPFQANALREKVAKYTRKNQLKVRAA
jgi:CheY-like chemotaxis protein